MDIAGWYIDFADKKVNARNMTHVFLYARGIDGGERIPVGLKDSSMDADADAIFAGDVTLVDSWNKVIIPLTALRGR